MLKKNIEITSRCFDEDGNLRGDYLKSTEMMSKKEFDAEVLLHDSDHVVCSWEKGYIVVLCEATDSEWETLKR